MSRDAQLKRARQDLSSRGQLKSGKRRERPFRSVKLHWPSKDPPTFGCKILTHYTHLIPISQKNLTKSLASSSPQSSQNLGWYFHVFVSLQASLYLRPDDSGRDPTFL